MNVNNYDKEVYNKYKEQVFMSAELTEWGKEFREMVGNGSITNYMLITSASDRMYVLCNVFDITSDNRRYDKYR